MTNYADIKDYHVLRWRSCMSLSVEHFTSLLRIPELQSNFDIDFAVRLGERTRELQRLDFRLSFLLFPPVILLGAFDSEFIQNFTVFGISFSKDNVTLSLILLPSAILMLLSSACSMVAAYYTKILEGYISVYHDNRVASFYIHQFVWNIGSMFDATSGSSSSISHNLFTVTVVGFWVAAIGCAAIITKVLVLLIVVGATISTFGASNIPDFINLPIVALATCAIVFDITCLLLQCPLPFTDYSNLEKLKEVERSNPDLADEIHTSIATRGLERDRRHSLVFQSVVVIGCVIGPTWLVIGNELFTRYQVAFQLLVGLVVVVMVVSPLADRVEGIILRRVFELEDRKLGLERYISTKKWMWRVRLALAAAIGLVVFWQPL